MKLRTLWIPATVIGLLGLTLPAQADSGQGTSPAWVRAAEPGQEPEAPAPTEPGPEAPEKPEAPKPQESEPKPDPKPDPKDPQPESKPEEPES